MSHSKSSISGGIFIVFWVLSLGVLVLLFSNWYESTYGGMEKIIVNDSEKKVILSMHKSNYFHVEGKINTAKVSFIVDTGANSVAVPADIAKLASLKSLGNITVQTAGGPTQAQMTWINRLSIGPIVLQNIKAVILPGHSKHVLLGMSALKKLTLKQHDNVLELIQPVDK